MTVIVDYIVQLASARTQSCDSNSGLRCRGSLSEDSHVTVIVDYIVEVASVRTQSCDSE